MNAFVFYLLGYLAMAIAYVVYEAVTGKYGKNRGLCWYEALKIGALSWAGVIFAVALGITYGVCMADAWIVKKLGSK